MGIRSNINNIKLIKTQKTVGKINLAADISNKVIQQSYINGQLDTAKKISKDILSFNGRLTLELRPGYIDPKLWPKYNDWINSEKLNNLLSEYNETVLFPNNGRVDVLKEYFSAGINFGKRLDGSKSPYVNELSVGPFDVEMVINEMSANGNPIRGRKELTALLVEDGVLEKSTKKKPATYHLTQLGAEFAKLYTVFGHSVPFNTKTMEELQKQIDDNYPDIPLYVEDKIGLSPGLIKGEQNDYLVQMEPEHMSRIQNDNKNIVGEYRRFDKSILLNSEVFDWPHGLAKINSLVRVPSGSIKYDNRANNHNAFYGKQEDIVFDEFRRNDHIFIVEDDRTKAFTKIHNLINSVDRIKGKTTGTALPAVPMMITTDIFTDKKYTGLSFANNGKNKILCSVPGWTVNGRDNAVIHFNMDLSYLATLSKVHKIPVKDIEFCIRQPNNMEQMDAITYQKTYGEILATNRNTGEVLGVNYSLIAEYKDSTSSKASKETMIDTWRKMGEYI